LHVERIQPSGLLLYRYGSGGRLEDMWLPRIAWRPLMRWHACMLREFNLVGCSYIDIIDYRFVKLSFRTTAKLQNTEFILFIQFATTKSCTNLMREKQKQYRTKFVVLPSRTPDLPHCSGSSELPSPYRQAEASPARFLGGATGTRMIVRCSSVGDHEWQYRSWSATGK
jgi:hypothetical protein